MFLAHWTQCRHAPQQVTCIRRTRVMTPQLGHRRRSRGHRARGRFDASMRSRLHVGHGTSRSVQSRQNSNARAYIEQLSLRPAFGYIFVSFLPTRMHPFRAIKNLSPNFLHPFFSIYSWASSTVLQPFFRDFLSGFPLFFHNDFSGNFSSQKEQHQSGNLMFQIDACAGS